MYSLIGQKGRIWKSQNGNNLNGSYEDVVKNKRNKTALTGM